MRKTKKEKASTITKMPDCLLWVKGWLDAFHGERVVDANIDKYRSLLCAIEHEEVNGTEAELYNVRTNAANCISIINKDITVHISEEASDAEVRANQRNRDEKNRAKNAILEANELIISESVRLQERIARTRDRATEKINAYVAGVRSNQRLKEYEIKKRESHSAIELYEEKHRFLNNAIMTLAYDIGKEGK